MSETQRGPKRESAPVLALKLVIGRGVEKLGLVRLTPDGCGVARALALGDASLGAARWRAADRCRIAKQGDDWSISNHCSWLVCSLNGRLVRAGTEAILQVGDTLELDLLRFVVVVDPGIHQRSDTLDKLAIGRGAPHAADAAKRRSAAPDDLFDRLNEEFVAAARDPLHLSGHAEWRRANATIAEDAPTIDELCTQARPFPSLRDVLLPRASIDRTIEAFDSFGAVDPSHRAYQEDVLRLFAPDIANRGATQLPSLTRREHHVVSIDSAIALGEVRPGDHRMAL